MIGQNSQISSVLDLPDHLNGRWLFIGLTLTVLACGLFIDFPALRFFHNLDGTAFVAFFRSITGFAHGGIWYGIALAGVVVSWVCRAGQTSSRIRNRWTRRMRSFGFMIVAMAASGIAINVLKVVIGRYRPRYYLFDDMSGFQPFNFDFAMNSFPSGHSQSICAAMTALVILVPRIWPVAISVAVLVSASRFITSVHFISDVIAGAVIGVGMTLWVARKFEHAGAPLRLSDR